MFSCEQCRELIWDHVYDLLDADESCDVEVHVADCPACHAEMEKARNDRQLLAEVACLDVPAPRLVFPAKEVVTLPAQRPFQVPARPQARHWGWVVSAVAILVVVA